MNNWICLETVCKVFIVEISFEGPTKLGFPRDCRVSIFLCISSLVNKIKYLDNNYYIMIRHFKIHFYYQQRLQRKLKPQTLCDIVYIEILLISSL